MISSLKTTEYSTKLESAELFLKPLLEEKEKLTTGICNRMRSLAEKLNLKLIDDNLRKQRES